MIETAICVLLKYNICYVCESNTGTFMFRMGSGSLFLLLFFCGTVSLASSTCEEEFTDGLLWPAWVKEQGNLSPEDRCASYREDECTCPNPLNPNDYNRARTPVPLPDMIKQLLWRKQRQVNIDRAAKSAKATRTPDLIVYGDSIIEFWTGTALGLGRLVLKDNRKVYEDLLRNTDAPLYGLALGISGDFCTNLLYRIQNGELPSDMNPALIWILIGSNDLANPGCSAAVTTACLINLVETIRDHKPNATIVFNSILPRGEGTLAAVDGAASDADDFSLLWMDILQVNQRLECFASGESRVEFFNTTDLFITNDDKNNKVINETLMLGDFAHPSAEGYRIFGEALVERALEILN